MKKAIVLISFILLLTLPILELKSVTIDDKIITKETDATDHRKSPTKNGSESRKITISAIGDCTFASDSKYGNNGSFDSMVEAKSSDYSYFFKNVKAILDKDDLTIANFESTLTDATYKTKKEFNFKSKAEYAQILIAGSVDAVNISNNHILDYGEEGLQDTKDNLEKYNIPYFGMGSKCIIERKGVKIGLLGYKGFHEGFISQMRNEIQSFRRECSIVIVSFHWGEEKKQHPNATQKKLAHLAIDYGADIVIGHHPHVLQGIEKYKNRTILYSIGNFVFGGNKNPSDKDTMIFQDTFKIDKNGTITQIEDAIIPCKISSKNYLNDFCPTLATDEEEKRIRTKLENLSAGL